MPGAFSGIYTTSGAMRAFQAGIDLAGTNIANVNTPGYSRRRLDLRATTGVDVTLGATIRLGSGVSVSSISRAKDAFLERSGLNNQGNQGRMGALATSLEQIERAYGEPSQDGISAALGKLFDGFSALGNDPTNPASRTQVRSAAQTLTDRIRAVSQELDAVEADINSAIRADLDRITTLTETIAGLNKEIVASTASGGEPHDLVDARANSLMELGQILRIDAHSQPDGSISVFTSGYLLADAAGVGSLPPGLDPAAGPVDPNVLAEIRSGSLVGRFESLSRVQNEGAQLDSLSVSLRDELNALHRTGINALGQTGINLFDPASGGRSFQLSSEVRASAQAIAAGVSGKASDGGLAQEMSRMREASVASLGGRTFEATFQRHITELASDVQYYRATADTEATVGEQIQNQKQAVTGVSLDDEFAEMVRWQRSYQAAARALNIMNSVTEDLLGMIR